MEVTIGGEIIHLVEEQPAEAFAPIFSDAWTGSRVWAAAHALAGHLADAGGLSGLRCVELGAGPGLCGLAASALGAASVVLTDQREMIELLRRNIALNPQLQGVTAAELNWAAPPDSTFEPPYDLVLASECVNEIYGTASFAQLAATIRALCVPTGVCLLSHEERLLGDGSTPAIAGFLELCMAEGLVVHRLGDTAGGHDGRIHLYEIRPGRRLEE